MQKITPFLWFEKDIPAVVAFYQSVFPGTVVKAGGELSDTPSGNVQMATIEVFGCALDLMTAGPYLPFNPSVSFIISCDSLEEVDELWTSLTTTEHTIMMPLQTYPFATKFGWVTDRYSVSWQIMFGNPTMPTVQKVTPALMFCGDVCGRTEEAVNFYTSVFHNSEVRYLVKYDESDPTKTPGAVVKHTGFTLEHFQIAAMDNGHPSGFTFRQAISFVVTCETQADIDYYWEKLTDGGEEVQCGWLNDKFGFPWQIVPSAMSRMMSTGTK